jgi:hypothetical protein
MRPANETTARARGDPHSTWRHRLGAHMGQGADQRSRFKQPPRFVGIRTAHTAQLTAAFCGVIACGAVAAYGSKDTSVVPPNQLNRNVVVEADIRATRAGTPQRTLVEWFQAVQFDDVEGVRRLTAPTALRLLRPAKLAADVEAVAPAMAKPRLVSARIGRSRAAVRVLLLSYALGKAKPVLSIPATLALVKVRGRWLMGDLALLVNGARAASVKP